MTQNILKQLEGKAKALSSSFSFFTQTIHAAFLVTLFENLFLL